MALSSLSLFISKYSWVIILFGVIVWVTYMIMKKPTRTIVEGKAPPKNFFERVTQSLEQAQLQYAKSNFKKNMEQTYGQTINEENLKTMKQDEDEIIKEEEEKKKEVKNEKKPEDPWTTNLDPQNVFKKIDF